MKTQKQQEKQKQKQNKENTDIDSDTDSKNQIPEPQKQPSHTGVLINPNQKQEKDKITDFLELKENDPTTTKKMNYPAQGEAINDFNCQGLLTMAFPYLFPDGLGDPTHSQDQRRGCELLRMVFSICSSLQKKTLKQMSMCTGLQQF